MAEDRDTYEATKARLEEIASSVRKKDVSLEKSIELLEEGVRLANLCTEQVDQVTFVAPEEAAGGEGGTTEGEVAAKATGTPDAAEAEAESAESRESAEGEDSGDVTGETSEDAADEDADVLEEAFADVEGHPDHEAGDGQTEAF